ncbi:hypothetical protein PACTADRAFT_3835 [Pachysolen tannophilus NRRL Y-2460]|uniref:Uncharacterized protein n=1 Tax=Pachysolen tannophilus NRRL Y-2460 TaxID=669874 RepID=A0A1E4TTE2_PACTA|nr:hypothetical protein PACTADRAFT_3835 [Pachysolen tannophilus NRRL Y-2460]
MPTYFVSIKRSSSSLYLFIAGNNMFSSRNMVKGDKLVGILQRLVDEVQDKHYDSTTDFINQINRSYYNSLLKNFSKNYELNLLDILNNNILASEKRQNRKLATVVQFIDSEDLIFQFYLSLLLINEILTKIDSNKDLYWLNDFKYYILLDKEHDPRIVSLLKKLIDASMLSYNLEIRLSPKDLNYFVEDGEDSIDLLLLLHKDQFKNLSVLQEVESLCLIHANGSFIISNIFEYKNGLEEYVDAAPFEKNYYYNVGRWNFIYENKLIKVDKKDLKIEKLKYFIPDYIEFTRCVEYLS